MNNTDLIEFKDDPALSARIRNTIRDNRGGPLCRDANASRVYQPKSNHLDKYWHTVPGQREQMTMEQFREYVDSPIV